MNENQRRRIKLAVDYPGTWEPLYIKRETRRFGFINRATGEIKEQTFEGFDELIRTRDALYELVPQCDD